MGTKHWVAVYGAVELPENVTADHLHDKLVEVIEALGGVTFLHTAETIPDDGEE